MTPGKAHLQMSALLAATFPGVAERERLTALEVAGNFIVRLLSTPEIQSRAAEISEAEVSEATLLAAGIVLLEGGGALFEGEDGEDFASSVIAALAPALAPDRPAPPARGRVH